MIAHRTHAHRRLLSRRVRAPIHHLGHHHASLDHVITLQVVLLSDSLHPQIAQRRVFEHVADVTKLRTTSIAHTQQHTRAHFKHCDTKQFTTGRVAAIKKHLVSRVHTTRRRRQRRPRRPPPRCDVCRNAIAELLVPRHVSA
jgi:hypothetical protein